jgi:hypothetical protein
VVGTMLGFVVGWLGWFITKTMIYRNTLLEWLIEWREW